MIVGLGTDLVDIRRIRAFRERWGQRGLRRIFSDGELRYCLGRTDPEPSLAARFAAKEAFFKAVGLGWGRGGDWAQVEVRRDSAGRPELALSGRAARVADGLGVRRLHVTLTHAEEAAVATVILES